jgi:hypothetical protein
MANSDALPPQAFDGQIFIDAFRVKWQFDGSAQCWKNIGQCSDIPVASELQTGLLSARLKQLLDSIPPGGGHFGIVAQPLLSLVPQNPNIVHKGQILKTTLTESGTKVNGVEERPYTPEQFVGKILIFKTGVLIKKAFLIFTNDEDAIFIEGDATAAVQDDKFEVVEATDLNPSGVMLGDIMLVSDSIDITCVDGEGIPLVNNENCNLDIIQCDNVDSPPGLNLQISQDFLDSLCVIIPGCKGSRGDRGDVGDIGPDGTGDGPEGEQGDPGENAPEVGHAFSGIKIIDIDDIFDTAVVSMELDAENGKLNIVRAKVRTPDSNTPATQLISTPINRSLRFDDNTSFDYEIMKPTVDPIPDVDPDILKYPPRYGKSEGASRTTTVNKIKLSEIVDAVVAHYEEKLLIINNEYNQQLKTYIEGKDEAARNVLAELAQKVAECEFELPIDFCLGISPDDCQQTASVSQSSFEFALADSILALPTAGFPVTATSLGTYTVPATAVPEVFSGGDVIGSGPSSTYITPSETSTQTTDTFVPVQFPSNTVNTSSPTLPAGFYVVKINPENSAIRSSETDGWIINSDVSGEGLELVVTEGSGSPMVISGSPPAIEYNQLEKSSVERAYSVSSFPEQVLCVELTEPGTISMCAFVPGSSPSGSIHIEVLGLDTPAGTSLLA